MPRDIDIEPSWYTALQPTFETAYFTALVERLRSEKRSGATIYPEGKDIFRAFELTPIQNVRVVILGQDPYHRRGQAMGLSFSVPNGIRIPPSLRNVYKELEDDINGWHHPGHGDLTNWAEQGVFLLNAALTVAEGRAGSHRNYGWMTFTDEVIRTLSAQREHLVFLLWGNFARDKRTLIDDTKHLILEAVHPSPLARGGFFGCKHFSQANDYLVSTGQKPIDWRLPS